MTRQRRATWHPAPRACIAVGRLVMVSQVVGLGRGSEITKKYLTSYKLHVPYYSGCFVLRRDDHAHAPSGGASAGYTPHRTWGGTRPAQTQHAHEPPNPCVHALRTSCVCVAHFSVAVLWHIISLLPFCGVLRACKCACSGMLPTIARAASHRPSIARFVTGDFTRPRRPCYPCTSR